MADSLMNYLKYKAEEDNLFRRVLATGGDILGNVFTGAAKGIEGIIDAGAGVVGAVGGIFDKGFQEDVKRVIEYDATNEWLGKPLDELTKESFTNESEIGRIVESVANGFGQMLPTVAVSLIPGVGQGAALATMGVSAAGSGTEEAFKDGGDYYKGLGYGLVSGATEVATEKLFGGLTKGITGKGVLDFGKDVAEQGAKRFIKGAVEEGLEEVASEAVNPLTKAIYKGKDALKEYTNPEYYKGLGEAFTVGAGTGMLYGGTVGKAINRARGINEDIGASVEAIQGISDKLTRAQDNGTLAEDAERSAAAAELQNLKNIEAKLKGAEKTDRAKYIKNYRLSDTFNEDGSLKPEILAEKSARAEGREFTAGAANGENVESEPLDKRFYSVNLRGKEQQIRADLAEMSADAGEDIHVHTEELTEKGQANFSKMKKALTSLNEHRGENVNYVIVNPNSKFNGAERRGDTIYIAADTLERDASTAYLDEASRNGNFAGTLMHEYEHTTEGTLARLNLNSFIEQDGELANVAAERVFNDYGISRAELENIRKKKKDGVELSKEESEKIDTFDREYGATLSEYALGNERVINKLVLENEPLVEKILDKLQSFRDSLAGKTDGYTRAERRRIDKALDLYLKAAEAAGKRDLVKKIITLREEDEETVTPTDGSNTAENAENQPSNDHKTENMNVSGGEVKFSRKGVNKDGIEVYETSEAVLNLPWKERKKLYLFYIEKNYIGRTAKFVRNGHVYYAEFDRKNASKAVYGDRRSDNTGRDALINTGADGSIFELVENTTYSRSGKDTKNHTSTDYFDYYIKTVQINNRVFDLLADVKRQYSKDGGFVYTIRLVENKKIKASPIQRGQALLNYSDNALIENTSVSESVSNNSITDSTEKVNSETKFSIKSSTDTVTMSKGEVQKRKANYESDKVYSKSEVSKAISNISGLSHVAPKVRTEIVEDIWKGLNSRYSVEQRKQYAELMSNKIFWTVMQESAGFYDEASSEEIAAMEREIYSVLQEIAKKGGSLSTRAKLEAEFNASDAGYWKKQRDDIVKRHKVFGEILEKAKKLKELKTGAFLNATNFKNDILDKCLKELSRIEHRSNFNVSGTTKILKRMLEWYDESNPLFQRKNQDTGKVEVSTDFDRYIRASLQYLSSIERGFNNSDLAMLNDVMGYFTKLVENYNKIRRNNELIDAKPTAERYVDIIKANSKVKVGWIHKWLLEWKHGRAMLRPSTVATYADKGEQGFYTDTLNEFRQGEIAAANHEYELMEGIREFEKNHKNYLSGLSHRKIHIFGSDLPVSVAMSLYMTSKRKQAIDALERSGFIYEDGKSTVKIDGMSVESIRTAVEEKLTEQDKVFIKVAENVFNNLCKKLKRKTDMEMKGYSNTVEDYYYPIFRAFISKSVDSDYSDLASGIINASFNKNTTPGAKGKLCIMPMDQVLRRHIRGVSQYAGLSSAVRNYDILYNLNVGNNPNNPISVASEGVFAWKDGDEYMRHLIEEITGKRHIEQGPFLSVLRGAYAVYQLGGNVKTWFTQLSSILASTSELDTDCVMKGITISGNDVDEYCTLAKLRNANNDAVLAQANANNTGLLTQKRTKAGDMAKKIGDALMQPISYVDRIVITRLFGACQAQIEKNGGAKIGTKENKVEAGKLLERVIFNTQQNSYTTERSALMRGGDIGRSVSMFSADAMNTNGQVIDGMLVSAIKKAKLSAETDKVKKAGLEKEMHMAQKRARKAIFALLSTSTFMAALSYAFNRWVFGREPEEDETFIDNLIAGTLGNMLGGFPVIRDAYSYLFDGYDVSNYAYSILNDTLETVSNIRNLAEKTFSNEPIESQEAARMVRNLIYSTGQLTGIPARNLYNTVRGVMSWFSDSAVYKLDNAFYKQAYSSDLEKAIEAGDEDMIATITGIMTGERVGAIKSDKVSVELNALTLKGYSVLPKAVADSITMNGEKVNLTNTQKKKFKEIYSIANESVEQLVSLKQYADADEAVKAAAIKRIYDTYYRLAKDEVLGSDTAVKDALFAEAIDIENLAIIVATANTLTADKDKNGNAVSGSKKRKIEKYIQSQRLTATQKYMIMGYLGYTNKNGKAQVRANINRLKLSKEEKQQLFKYSGYK